MERKHQFSMWYFLAAFLVIAALQDYLAPQHVNNLAYSDFKALLRAGKVSDVALRETVIAGTLVNEDIVSVVSLDTAKQLAKLSKGPHAFTVIRINDPTLVPDLEAAKVRFTGQIESKLLPTLISWIVPALAFFLIWSFFVKRMSGEQSLGGMGGLMSIGKSKAKVYMEADTKVTFADVAGVDEAKEELQEVVGFLNANVAASSRSSLRSKAGRSSSAFSRTWGCRPNRHHARRARCVELFQAPDCRTATCFTTWKRPCSPRRS